MKKWGIMAIMVIGLIFAGVYGAMMAHAEGAEVSTAVYVVKDKNNVTEVNPGDQVKIMVQVTNNGDEAFPLSNHAPVFAYANIYEYKLGELHKVQTVKFESKFVMWHVVTLEPGKTYTAYIDWTVPTNVSGTLYIEAWAGSAPKGTITINVVNPQVYNNDYVMVYTDEIAYMPGDVVHITIVNLGSQPAMFGSGFEVVNENGEKVTQKVWRHEIVLQPGESVEYTWTVPSDVDSGWYYIYSMANGNYAMIYIYNF